LAKTHRVTVAQLAEWNELNSQSKLQAGQSVVLFLTQAANGAKKKTSVQKAQAPKGDKLAKR
jgi:LysM repeat protein